MSLIMIDGFDSYGTGGGSSFGDNPNLWFARWSSYSRTDSGHCVANGRTGNYALIHNNGALFRNLAAGDQHATMILGCAVFGGNSNQLSVHEFRFNGSGVNHITIRRNADGSVGVWRNGTSTFLGGNSTQLMPWGGWYHMQMKVVIDDVAGSVEIKVNNVTVVNLTNIDTRNGGATALLDQIVLVGLNDSSFFDDFYLCNGAGTVNNTFLGDCRVQRLLPNATGTTTQLAGTGVTTGTWQNVDDAARPDSADYNSSATSEQFDTYGFADLVPPAGAYTVHGVYAQAFAWKSDTADRGLALMVRSGTTDHEGAAQTVTTTGKNYGQVFQLNPVTGLQWSQTEINGGEFGVRVKPS